VEAVSTTSKDLVNDVPVTPSHISNFALVPNSVEELIAVKFDAPCCLPPLLATAAFIAPRLQSLCLISGGCIDIGGSELRYLPLFSNLVELDLGAWCLEEYGSSVDLGYLSCAHSLKVRCIFQVEKHPSFPPSCFPSPHDNFPGKGFLYTHLDLHELMVRDCLWGQGLWGQEDLDMASPKGRVLLEMTNMIVTAHLLAAASEHVTGASGMTLV